MDSWDREFPLPGISTLPPTLLYSTLLSLDSHLASRSLACLRELVRAEGAEVGEDLAREGLVDL